MINRRNLLKFTLVSAVEVDTRVAKAATNDLARTGFDWRREGRRWLKLMAFPNQSPLPAELDAMWGRVEFLIVSGRKRESWFSEWFYHLSRFSNETGISDEESLLFIRYLRGVFLEGFYTSSHGWSEIGLSAPPQPYGYDI